MSRFLLVLASAFILLIAAQASARSPQSSAKASKATSAGHVVEISTSLGKIVVQLFPKKAPKTVANFLRYVRSQHYNGTIFHRVIPTFMIQGGGMT
ncbi:MAG: peptidylprolyl isomerase, partial [Deltaproteobacteria bacterium]|nr:peptidylprolyl isomerase [Deltaproteobacteria bacterium]